MGLTLLRFLMELEMTRVSSKGQVVIPGLIREKLGLKSGSQLMVFGEGDTIILKKVALPSSSAKETLASVRQKVRSLGLTRDDVRQEIRRVRARRAKAA
jgi:antitoxin PrlF